MYYMMLKYLRRFGCDREIFSFKAGQKCQKDEGLYAFSTKKASYLFNLVENNISALLYPPAPMLVHHIL